jgi:hypothetical protein
MSGLGRELSEGFSAIVSLTSSFLGGTIAMDFDFSISVAADSEGDRQWAEMVPR